ncbi:HEAT repeat domain-containing protein [Dactylosporangium sp. CA-233914]|uniref:HEAT repeat domain-containing protein n=1 Tax=Dactylosporangium sp. CA-233914 TaxID=3239934 RepID=UPI003D929B71
MRVERPGSVPPGAKYDIGNGQWRAWVTDGERATERVWLGGGELAASTTLHGGAKTLVQHFHRDGRLAYEWVYRDGVEVSRRAWYEDGTPYYETEFAAGEITRSIRYSRAGSVESETAEGRTRTFFPSGAVASECFDDHTTWFAAGGSVVATEEPHPEIQDAYLRREFHPGGRLRAEGHVDRRAWSADGAVGFWRLFAADGTVRGEVDFEPLHRPPKDTVADVAETLLAWQSLPRAGWLDGAEAVAWNRQKVFDGWPEHLSFHLNGLSCPREDVFDLALSNLSAALYAQGTVAAAAKRVAPILVEAAATLDGAHRDRVVELLVTMLSGGGSLDTAELRLRAGASTAAGALRVQVAARIDRWRQLAGDGDAWAARLLPLAAGRTRGHLVLSDARSVTDPLVRAELTVGLCLVRPAAGAVPWLRDQLGEPDPRQRFCAGVALARLGDPAGADVLVDAVTAAPPGYAELFWTGRSTEAAACAALGRIGEGLPALLAAFERAPATVAIDIARALLDVAFRQRPDALTAEQRQVLRAIVEHRRVWEYVNLTDLLGTWNLPTDRDALNGMAETDPDSSPEHTGR